MGCCEGVRAKSIAEQFIQNIILQMKLSTMSLYDVKEYLTSKSTMKESISKKLLNSDTIAIKNDNHYENKIFELIFSLFNETFEISHLLFFLFAFVNENNIEKIDEIENTKSLYELFKSYNNNNYHVLTYGYLEKLLVDYICFYTIKLNFCIETNVLYEEDIELKREIKNLNQKYYTYNNIHFIVKKIIGDSNENEVVTSIGFDNKIQEYKLHSFIELRNLFVGYFGDVDNI